MEAARVTVEGVTYRVQTASKADVCDACDRPIPIGSQYVRVIEGKVTPVAGERRPRREHRNGLVEKFHNDCFKDEFTDAES